jgi:hypothetical protein
MCVATDKIFSPFIQSHGMVCSLNVVAQATITLRSDIVSQIRGVIRGLVTAYLKPNIVRMVFETNVSSSGKPNDLYKSVNLTAGVNADLPNGIEDTDTLD